MKNDLRPPRGVRRRRWKQAALVAALTALAVAVLAPQAPAHVTKDLPHMLEHVLEAIGAVQGTTDAIKAKTDSLPVIVTDNFEQTASGLTSRNIDGMQGKQFLANVTAYCTFGSFDNNPAKNIATVSFRIGPSGENFLTTFSAESTDRVVHVVTGPVVGFDGFDATYHVNCSPGSGNSFARSAAQARFEVLP